MKKLACALLLIFAIQARADITDAPPPPAAAPSEAPSSGPHSKGIMVEAVYGASSVSPSTMNTALNNYQWQNSVYAKGPINDLQFFALAFGYKIGRWGYLKLRYEQQWQTMLPVLVSSTTYSITNEFKYQPIYLIYEMPLYRSGLFSVSGIAGVGYAIVYELHQSENPGEDVTWQANPIPYRIGTNINYSFADNFDLFLDIFFEGVSSKLKAASSYSTTLTPVTSGQYFTDQGSGSVVNANLSGLRYGLGVKIRF